ncbi:hypothetical protein WQ54_21345 [Bacillus sp. SA1-12]|uniref:hypothetical protein n=1 Tax=Bacillus sp. SA1-12 TaxID=1455638 RepID=UPI00062716F4|nr:hypothetical protein [Bacillus sp. SA1-12]KKI90493.1 hypothetical protein WQ54_21345 [Bacillus sp. SA1-12]
MSIHEEELQVNDYLDLYLFAGQIGDPLWQQEIIEKLKTIQSKKKQNQSTLLKNLIERYKQLNDEILSIYNQKNHQYFDWKLRKLKHQRLIVGRQIRTIQSSSFTI